MKKSKPAKKVTMQEWFYLGCLTFGGVVAIVAVSIMASRPAPADHSSTLLEASGVVPWYSLAKVSFAKSDGKSVLSFGASVNKLDGRAVKLRGYITPLQMGTDQKHFILSPKPPSCAFCVPAGPDEMVEVFANTAVKYSLEPVTISGTFAVLRNDPGGLFYRLAEAAAVPAEGRL
jgi:hypothetical protein